MSFSFSVFPLARGGEVVGIAVLWAGARMEGVGQMFGVLGLEHMRERLRDSQHLGFRSIWHIMKAKTDFADTHTALAFPHWRMAVVPTRASSWSCTSRALNSEEAAVVSDAITRSHAWYLKGLDEHRMAER